jgi:uncharacterized protein YjbI with pentapeptide repeats
MDDETRLAVDDAETPVNPYSLLAAVNASGRSANVAWLLFLGVAAYLLIAVAAVSHRDLLLNADVVLPLLQVKIGLLRFFLLVPILLVVLHAGLLGKLALFARKTLEFDAAVRLLESTDERTHPLRLELDGFFLAQALAGPERSRVMSAFLNGVSWLTLAILPVVLLLLVQIAFLPFHDPAVTIAHRLAVLADIVLLLLMGVFLVRPETTYFGAFWRTALHNPGSLAFGVVVLVAAACVSAVATVPGDGTRGDWTSRLMGADGALFGVFPRNLQVTDADLVGGRDPAPGARTVSLRGRDLRGARLDRSDLRQADMTGANLDGASLAAADLRRIDMRCSERTDLRPSETRAAPLCASARGANFAGTRLDGAGMTGIDLSGARFQGASLEGARLAEARAAGADFSGAELPRADLAGAALQGASFQQANLQGADLASAQLQMSDFSGAWMQGAALAAANLEGAVLRDTALEAASLRMAKLFAADLRGASLQLADLSGAFVWQTLPPSSGSVASADLGNLVFSAPTEDDMTRMRSALDTLGAAPDKVRLAALATPLNDAAPNNAWRTSTDGQAWAALVTAAEAGLADDVRTRVTSGLAQMACRASFGDGAVAAGIVRRALSGGFKGDVAALYGRLKGSDCPAAAALPASVLRDLGAAAGQAGAQ